MSDWDFNPDDHFVDCFHSENPLRKKGWKVGAFFEAMLPKQVSQPRLVGDKLLKLREAGGWMWDLVAGIQIPHQIQGAF